MHPLRHTPVLLQSEAVVRQPICALLVDLGPAGVVDGVRAINLPIPAIQCPDRIDMLGHSNSCEPTRPSAEITIYPYAS